MFKDFFGFMLSGRSVESVNKTKITLGEQADRNENIINERRLKRARDNLRPWFADVKHIVRKRIEKEGQRLPQQLFMETYGLDNNEFIGEFGDTIQHLKEWANTEGMILTVNYTNKYDSRDTFHTLTFIRVRNELIG